MLINLDKNFKPLGGGMDFQKFDFPSGCEPHVKLPAGGGTSAIITSRIRTGNDFLSVLLAADAMKRMGVKEIHLFIPYLPFARQDRVMVDGEPLALKVICDIINAQGFEEVVLYDVHSEVALALLNNSRCVSNHNFVAKVLKGKTDYLIVSPDAGAYKKIFKLCQSLHYKDEIIMCNKLRNLNTGSIQSLTVSHEDLEGKDIYIVDDICDGGGTFIGLAEELRQRNCGKINLIVSHGIFSKGIEALSNVDHIYTTDSFQDIVPTKKLTQIKLSDGLLS